MRLNQKYLYRGAFVVVLTGRKATNKTDYSEHTVYEIAYQTDSAVSTWGCWASIDELVEISDEH